MLKLKIRISNSTTPLHFYLYHQWNDARTWIGTKWVEELYLNFKKGLQYCHFCFVHFIVDFHKVIMQFNAFRSNTGDKNHAHSLDSNSRDACQVGPRNCKINRFWVRCPPLPHNPNGLRFRMLGIQLPRPGGDDLQKFARLEG